MDFEQPAQLPSLSAEEDKQVAEAGNAQQIA
jgi:hypothetical protein